MRGSKFINKPVLLSLILSAGVIAFAFFLSGHLDRTPAEDSSLRGDPDALAGSQEKFDYLASQSSNQCGLQMTSIESYADGERIQGSCCAPMDLHAYQEQIEYLKRYSDIASIPPDPYDVSASSAKQLIAYKNEIVLTAQQQSVYKQAAELSDEGGPCCCKCWHWDAYEGLAKYLIANMGWGAQEAADLWDASSACGGPGHSHSAA